MSQKNRDSTNSVTRRKLLLGAAAAPIATKTIFPDRWSRPIVDTVLLPAHAQTSVLADTETEDSSGGCSVPLTMADPEVNCSDTPFSETVDVFINDSGACPVLERDFPVVADPAAAFTIIRERRSSDRFGLLLRLDIDGSFETAITIDCPDGGPEPPRSRPFDFVVQADSGASWELRFDRVQGESFLAFRDIELSPL